ncbi:hypothetical protein NEOLEDRAFT_1096792 [Neolentinus lepideus HHB14362 ss-1]|uniref:Uncharacterized protein n=1 Tax=Neolentinus lepideus HHB14362 ss-1 TaxID=1314782 RepID=A0A165QYG0_9AGAM|nr:hypothetical protein NEOLEDRAFT_1096792 [Neolentinus lepideus HHB14362 ss-1]
MLPVLVPIQGPTILGAATYFEKTVAASRQGWGEERPSKLLKALKLVLKGPSAVESDGFCSVSYLSKYEPIVEEQLSWDSYTVVLSEGGVIRKRWSFYKDRQPVQWACIGRLDQPPKVKIPPSGPAHFTAASNVGPFLDEGQSKRQIFGPFHRARERVKEEVEPAALVRGVFVFFRTMCRIFLDTGIEYSFPLPFVTRKAWPIYPHGVLIQRSVDRTELAEAEASGEPILPTIFSMVNPRHEATPMGVTSGIIGGLFQRPVSLKDEKEYFEKPQKSMNSKEIVVGVSQRVTDSPDDIIVTYSPEDRRITIWRYAYLKPKDTPVPLQAKSPQVGNGQSQSQEKTQEAHPASAPPVPGVSGPLASAQTMADIIAAVESQKAAEADTRKKAEEEATQESIEAEMRAELDGPKQRAEMLDRQALPESTIDFDVIPPMHGRGTTPYWAEKLHMEIIPGSDEISWSKILVCVFDQRFDGRCDRSLLAICIPDLQQVLIFALVKHRDKAIRAEFQSRMPGISIASILATRQTVWDLLVVTIDHKLILLTHGVNEIPVDVKGVSLVSRSAPDFERRSSPARRRIVSLRDCVSSSVELLFDDGLTTRVSLPLYPWDMLTRMCLEILALTLPSDYAFALHNLFLNSWSAVEYTHAEGEEFESFIEALFTQFDIANDLQNVAHLNPWEELMQSTTHQRFQDDPALRRLRQPESRRLSNGYHVTKAHVLLAPILNALHHLGEDLRIDPHFYSSLMKLVPVISLIARVIRPEWADYWRRLCPTAPEYRLRCVNPVVCLDDRLPVWPPDMTVILFGRINRPDWSQAPHSSYTLVAPFKVTPSYFYGMVDPLDRLRRMSALYISLADNQETDTRKRAENAVSILVKSQIGPHYADLMALGISSPIQEAARTCQLSPPLNWPAQAYKIIGRNDITEQQSGIQDALSKDPYKSAKDYLNPGPPRRTIYEIGQKATMASKGDTQVVSGVELDLEDFTDVRFGNDRRLYEASHMLSSSHVPVLKFPERVEMSEHDVAKEQQVFVVRLAEKTQALPYGRAMFTYGCTTQAHHIIPKIEYSIRQMPHNIMIYPDQGRIPLDWMAWAEFHNGVAAALRISPLSTSIDGAWITFNKPKESTYQHGGFLLGLGLNGHLTHVLTWDLYRYLTPKHDATSIGLLLGLCASLVGTQNGQVMRLLTLHVPALQMVPGLSTSSVSVPIQAAGVAGLGLLYMGSSDRHMADICLRLIGTKEKGSANLTADFREAFVLTCGLAFGTIMLGRGSTNAADITYMNTLQKYVHGDPRETADDSTHPLDLNQTSAAATIALGLMYLKTGRKEVADIVSIPDTVLALKHVQPSFLMIRTIARCLIMWNSVQPSQEWLLTQIPKVVQKGIHDKYAGKPVDDSIELAYYNILAGCCFAVGLKYAGTAREQAYSFVVTYYDIFTRLAYANSTAYDYRIKRSAVRDGLNLISVSLGMIMAGTGEINCMRRLRYMWAYTHAPMRYGQHTSAHQALGLLFLGGGRYTLGTSDSAIAAMVMAFYPRYPPLPPDNKCYLQALRHMWVLAAEPRCLITRDVDTREVVYLPLKIKVKEPDDTQGVIAVASMISPTLIPDLDKLMSVRVDTPRYWPLHMDLTPPQGDQYRESLIRNQTLYVKRRTAFLDYTEDPKGSRSLFVRSGAATGDAATLDFPKLTDLQLHPASDLSQFITSYSNNVFFQAFADHFCRDEGETDAERLFFRYCHAVLLDAILQDKPRTLQSHVTLYHYRTMPPTHSYFSLWLQDLTFLAHFYNKVFDRRFSGRSENNARPPLLRENTTAGALYVLDTRLEGVRNDPAFLRVLARYARGEDVWPALTAAQRAHLAWYLLRNSVPVSTVLALLRGCARRAHDACIGLAEPEGTGDVGRLDRGIKEVLLASGSQMAHSYGTAWAVRSLDEVVACWREG